MGLAAHLVCTFGNRDYRTVLPYKKYFFKHGKVIFLNQLHPEFKGVISV